MASMSTTRRALPKTCQGSRWNKIQSLVVDCCHAQARQSSLLMGLLVLALTRKVQHYTLRLCWYVIEKIDACQNSGGPGKRLQRRLHQRCSHQPRLDACHVQQLRRPQGGATKMCARCVLTLSHSVLIPVSADDIMYHGITSSAVAELIIHFLWCCMVGAAEP